ncbi:MAG TPA: acyl carrier protein [Pirellulales bacterium]
MTSLSRAAVEERLAAVLTNFEGREYSGGVEPQTLLFGDLGFSSIEVVLLGEKLEGEFGVRFPFHLLLREVSDRGGEDLSVGELADFLIRHLP